MNPNLPRQCLPGGSVCLETTFVSDNRRKVSVLHKDSHRRTAAVSERAYNLYGAFLSGVEGQQQRHQGLGYLSII